MKHLVITLGDQTLFDGDVDEFTWSENANAVTVTGSVAKAPRPGTNGGGILDMLTQASRARTADKRAELTSTVEEVPNDVI